MRFHRDSSAKCQRLALSVLSRHLSATVVVGLALVIIAAPLFAQQPESGEAKPVQSKPDGVALIKQQQPSFLVRADLDRPSREYRDGDNLAVSVTSEIDAHVYVLYQQADGRTFMVFPNSAQKDNRLKAKETVSIPASGDLFRWKIGAPYGLESIKVLATEQPLSTLSGPMLAQNRVNPISKQLLRGIKLELGAEVEEPKPDEPGKTSPTSSGPPTIKVSFEKGRWAECLLSFTTYPPTHVFEHEKQRRYGAFFGVSRHKFAKYDEMVSGKNMDLQVAHRDAADFSKRMMGEGGLAEVQVYADDRATRGNMEYAITKWLPAVSKPGDTVFVYVAGHGSQVEDADKEEPDGLDEYLIPHDFFSLSAWLAMERQRSQGQLDPAMAEQHRVGAYVLTECLKKTNGDLKQALVLANQVMIRATAVTDDQFGHWLQALDGRQVIVILDICHSGGFSVNERSVVYKDIRATTAGYKEEFDFLDRELVRLKDIGQTNTALFSACAAKETTMERLELDNGLMTYCLMESLTKSPGQLTLPDAHQSVSTAMTGYLQRINQKLMQIQQPPVKPYQPLLFPAAAKTFLLKP